MQREKVRPSGFAKTLEGQFGNRAHDFVRVVQGCDKGAHDRKGNRAYVTEGAGRIGSHVS